MSDLVPRIGPVVDLRNPTRSRMSVLKDMRDRGEITNQQYEHEARAAGHIAGQIERTRQEIRAGIHLSVFGPTPTNERSPS